MNDEAIEKAAQAIARADALVITAGAGMGVDSGLPDFRGNEGFWEAYPPFQDLGLSFQQLANSSWFARDPELAWGFYGHRLNLYRRTAPHPGHGLLQEWIAKKPHGGFVFTSNVDGQFQRAGFSPDRVLECHGSIHHLQCTWPCTKNVWTAENIEPDVDETAMRARLPLPACPECERLARPNILMFGDGRWISGRADEQEQQFHAWLRAVGNRRLAVVECGAGSVVPTVRLASESLQASRLAVLIRINPTEPEGPENTIAIKMGALDALSAIQRALHK